MDPVTLHAITAKSSENAERDFTAGLAAGMELVLDAIGRGIVTPALVREAA